MGIRVKMRLENVFAQAWGGAKAIFRCEYDQKIAEDVSFQKATPSGHAEFQIDNPLAAKQLIIGRSYYVNFELVELPPPPPPELPEVAPPPVEPTTTAA